ncbi:MAG TPA: Uma2 family endonuclease [Ktedonobacterales bacterium]|jgi:Uma2 family endonuclease
MAHHPRALWAEAVPNGDDHGPRRLTAEELFALGDQSRGYELVEGVLVRMSPTGGVHGRVALKLAAALERWADDHAAGDVLAAETGFWVSQPGEADTVLAPDVAFVRAARVPARGSAEEARYWRLSPDLVAEVASPSEFHPQMDSKAKAWLAAGVRAVWVVWPVAQTVVIWTPGSDTPIRTLASDETLADPDVLPGFTFPISRLFA